METTDFSYSEKPPFRISKAPAQGLRHGHPRFAAQGLLFSRGLTSRYAPPSLLVQLQSRVAFRGLH